MADDLHLRVSRAKFLGYLIGNAAFISVGGWLITSHRLYPEMLGWATVVVFGSFFVLTLKKVVLGGARYIITEDGVDMRADGWGFIRWDEIASYRLVTTSMYAGPFAARHMLLPSISIALKDEASFRSRLAPIKRFGFSLNRSLGFEPPFIIPQGIAGGALLALEACLERFRQHGITKRSLVVGEIG